MPTILNVVLQRFTFHAFTMERHKLNDRVEFPFVLNFNKYMNGYENIPDKFDEDTSKYFYTEPKKKKVVTQRTKVKPDSTKNPSIAGKKSVKPSTGTS